MVAAHPDRQFFIVVSPFHEVFYRTFHGIDGAYEFLSDLKKHPNVTVVDLGRVDYPDELFMDATHLNEDGAERFSRDLGKILREYPAFAKDERSATEQTPSQR